MRRLERGGRSPKLHSQKIVAAVEDPVIVYLYTCHACHYTKVKTSLNVENVSHSCAN